VIQCGPFGVWLFSSLSHLTHCIIAVGAALPSHTSTGLCTAMVQVLHKVEKCNSSRGVCGIFNWGKSDNRCLPNKDNELINESSNFIFVVSSLSRKVQNSIKKSNNLYL
jgi:hypothetical protein